MQINSALLTDLYQVTMAQGYWSSPSKRNLEAAFHLHFRSQPFGGGYSIAAGLEPALRWMREFHVTEEDAEYLRTLEGNDGTPLFRPEFVEYLRSLRLDGIDVDAVPEGTVVFPGEPLIRVCGDILQAQLCETALLTHVNFSTLIATKAARVCGAASGAQVLEFGLRRAQGADGGTEASRAAYIGGCAGTSNLLAGRLFGIPVRGTHAHSWVMSDEDEIGSFRRWAEVSPNNCVFLVDTYDSLEGVRNAIEVGNELRNSGHELAGIRLDSGDLAWLSVTARKMLDDAGFPKAVVYASNDLDETVITALKAQGATIGAWGVGTRLVTAFDQPALGGVYKLSAVRKPGETSWKPVIKLSEQAVKISTPGVLQVRRFVYHGEAAGDVLWDETDPATDDPAIRKVVDPSDPSRVKPIPPSATHEDLLVPVMRKGGKVVYDVPSLEDVRSRVRNQLALFHAGIKRLVNPHQYPAGLCENLLKTKLTLVSSEREKVRLRRGLHDRSETPEISK